MISEKNFTQEQVERIKKMADKFEANADALIAKRNAKKGRPNIKESLNLKGAGRKAKEMDNTIKHKFQTAEFLDELNPKVREMLDVCAYAAHSSMKGLSSQKLLMVIKMCDTITVSEISDLLGVVESSARQYAQAARLFIIMFNKTF